MLKFFRMYFFNMINLHVIYVNLFFYMHQRKKILNISRDVHGYGLSIYLN